MHIYAVGRPYVMGTSHSPEAVEYSYRHGAHELRMFLSRPSQRELAELSTAPFHVGVFASGPVVFFLYRCGTTFEWSDAPYSYHLVTKREQVPPGPLGPDERALLTIIAVSADDGIVRALRAVSMPHDVSAALHAAIADQMHTPFDHGDYDRALAEAHRTFAHTQQMVDNAIATGWAGT